MSEVRYIEYDCPYECPHRKEIYDYNDKCELMGKDCDMKICPLQKHHKLPLTIVHNPFWDDGFNWEIILDLGACGHIIQRTMNKESAQEYIDDMEKEYQAWLAE
jgi:hypothetical protein